MHGAFLAGCKPKAAVLSVSVLFAGGCTPEPSGFDDQAFVDFAGGSVHQLRVSSGGEKVRFSLRADPGGDERLWFFFRVQGKRAVQPEFVLENPTEAQFANWGDVRPVVSPNGTDWYPAEEVSYRRSTVDRLLGRGRTFRFSSPVKSMTHWVAYTYPYTDADLTRFLQAKGDDSRVTLSTIGRSVAGRAVRRVRIAEGVEGKREIWVIGREHPGETPSSFVLEGIITALLSQRAGWMLDDYEFNIVPILNVDGVEEGNYYRNRGGVNLSLDWLENASPEVRSTLSAMRASLIQGRVALVVFLHSANAPRGHFFLKTPAERLDPPLRELQAKLIRAADGIHPQIQPQTTVELLDDQRIAGNFLADEYGVYCLYFESNYSLGADASRVTPESLRAVGAALATALGSVMVSSR